ncbi:MAG: CCA tRNA nucleotidyltransferase [Erysipelotrichaceae bacterium]|nr:CCA tRNA nucleotidyltransferase [Erysipelotrichaceae bacterium]
MKIDIPKPALTAIKLIEANNHEAYIVGGFVRDNLLGIKSNDCDITSSARPEEILNIFKDFKCYKTGIKHGTVLVIIDDSPLEITTYRIENEYKDFRHPSSVTYVNDLKSDLARRDFTINAFAYHPDKGVIDYFDGFADLENNLIRCINDPYQRFTEDALRILRALRFSSTYDFQIDKETKKAIIENYELLANISQERITEEWLKTLSGKNAKKIILEYQDLWLFLFHELLSYHEEWVDQLGKSLYEQCSDIEIKVAVFLYVMYRNDIKKFDCLLNRLRLKRKMIMNIKTILSLSTFEIGNRVDIKKRLKYVDESLLIKVIRFKFVLNMMDSKTMEDIIDTIHSITSSNEVYKPSHLAIKGNEIMENLTIDNSKIKGILDLLLDKVIEGSITNNKKELLSYAKMIIDDKVLKI